MKQLIGKLSNVKKAISWSTLWGDLGWLSSKLLLAFVITILATSAVAQKFEGLAMTPPMGWNSWNKFACDVSEKLIMETADAMVATGMKDAGYEYIVIDDCWQIGRDSLGFIVADPERFPSGIKALADYVHSKGLKFGIYSCAGDKTCGGRPGSRGYEYQDALMYAKWGVDYLKYDWCFTDHLNAQGAYTTMSKALKQAGHPIVFSLCEWGGNKPWLWAKEVGHLWRTTGDIHNCYDCVYSHGSWTAWGAMQILDMQDGLRQYAGPGHWNDPDMMQVGNGMTYNQERAHFSMWAMIAAPLMSGNDLRDMNPQTLSVLTNKEVIAVNQDKLGIQGFRHEVKDSVETWIKPLSDGSWAVAFLNRSEQVRKFSIDWNTFSVTDPLHKMTLTTKDADFRFRDVWEKKDLTFKRKKYQSDFVLGGDDIVMLVISPKVKK